MKVLSLGNSAEVSAWSVGTKHVRRANSHRSHWAATPHSSPQGGLEVELQLQQILQTDLSNIIDNVPGGEACQGTNGSTRSALAAAKPACWPHPANPHCGGVFRSLTPTRETTAGKDTQQESL